MSNKHALSDGESDDGPSQASSAKRQRTRDASSLPRSTPPQRADEDGEFDPDASEEEQEDEEMDEEEEQQQKRDLEAYKQTQNGKVTRVAEAGVIQQVDLHNFMCHAHTTVDFGPQVNFLVGVNGSGKSAILTGITMALGGNAKATNRGTKGGDLVMEGKANARCAVTIANKGEEAFMHHIYGDSITIERTMAKAGSGTYKIKNHEGKTVDTKKATLDAILDSFNIQVDNPMTVLTQDQSRQFLASASPKDKYTFFLRGTQLAQLTEEYEQIRHHTEQMEEALARKKEVLPELKDAYRRAKERAKDAQAAVAQQENLETLKNQLAWAYVEEVEKQIAFGQAAIEKEQAKLTGIQTQIDEIRAEIDKAEEQTATLNEAAAESRETARDKEPRLAEIKQQLEADKARAKRWKDSERQLNATIERIRDAIASFENDIAAEERKLSRDLEAERRPLREKIATANAEIEQLSDKINDAKRVYEDAGEEKRKAVEQWEDCKAQMAAAVKMQSDARARLQNVQMSQTSPMTAFGPKTPQMLEAIRRETRWREQVIGPIGSHVKLKQPQYAKVIESFYGPSFNAYVATNDHDHALLKGIAQRLDLGKQIPIIRQVFDDSFDCSSGEPDPSILTIHRALTFDNELVRQVLINTKAMEKAALVPQRADGDVLMRSNPRNVESAYSGDCFQVRINQGKSSSSAMQFWRGPPRFVRDTTAELQHWQGEITRIEGDLQAMDQKKQDVGARARHFEQQLKQAENTVANSQHRMRKCNQVVAQCEAKLNEEQPNNIAALQESKQESEAELECALAQFRGAQERFEREQGNNEDIVAEKREIEAKIKKADKIAAQIASHLDKQAGIIAAQEAKMKQAEKEKKSAEELLESYETEVAKTIDLRNERTELASSICDRPVVEKYKDPRKLQKDIDALEKALKDRERRQGATLEQIMEELDVRKKVTAEAVKQTNDMAKLIQKTILNAFYRLYKALSAAYEKRISRWADFRDHIGHRAKIQFLNHLSTRGFTGKLRFDHEGYKLNLTVQTDDPDKAKKSKLKDAKSLSGGEKSFSTICLLLTMWEAVGCPIRCLDEFDVFMDAVNRRIAMNMMVETAKLADQTQFILITPQEMTALGKTWGSEVKVVKLADPKRASGALAQGR
ncbi:hypothetical protein JCM6882_000510 [Rhodosporidiobolus microsporus]